MPPILTYVFDDGGFVGSSASFVVYLVSKDGYFFLTGIDGAESYIYHWAI